MPRSRRRIDADNRAIGRLRDIFKDLTKDYTGKMQASILTDLLHRRAPLMDKIERDKALVSALLTHAIQDFFRDFMREFTPADDEVGTEQLELFPAQERPLVRAIAMMRIWVPSQNAHLRYSPETDIPTKFLREAADYYQAQSIGQARTAGALRRLAEMREGRAPAAAVA